MKAQWLVAKYMPDLRRREPSNVGVALRVDNKTYCRFRGQVEDGTINGIHVRGWSKDLANYKSWVESWCYRFGKWDLEKLVKVSNDQNYFLEFGGERLVGNADTNPQDLLDELYSMLVEKPQEEVVTVNSLSDNIFKKLNVYNRMQRDFKLAIPAEAGAFDEVFFDYKYKPDDSKVTLFQAIALPYTDARTWNTVHAAAWSFQKVAEHAGQLAATNKGLERLGQQIIALVKPRQRDPELEGQLSVLKRYATVINVADENAATSKLARILHV